MSYFVLSTGEACLEFTPSEDPEKFIIKVWNNNSKISVTVSIDYIWALIGTLKTISDKHAELKV